MQTQALYWAARCAMSDAFGGSMEYGGTASLERLRRHPKDNRSKKKKEPLQQHLEGKARVHVFQKLAHS